MLWTLIYARKTCSCLYLMPKLHVQVIISALDRPLSRLVKTVAAVRDMKVPEGCSKSVHLIYDARSAAY